MSLSLWPHSNAIWKVKVPEDVEIEVAPEVDDLSLSFHSTQNRRLQSDQSLDHTVELRGTTGAATCCLFHLRWQCLRIPACQGV